MAENSAKKVMNCNTESDSARQSPLCGSRSSEESKMIEKLLMTVWGDNWSKPMSAAELLEMGRETIDPLFQEPHIGPIPEYLRPHLQVHSCVAEYEDKLEEIDKWKARKLDTWLKDKTGQRYMAGPKMYLLRSEEGKSSTPYKYWFDMIEEPNSRKI
ncbi:MAG: hypothetical protein WCA04_09480 [Geobacteraceae bacterium]